MEYVIEMNHITKQFGDFKANDDITLQVKKGEVHALLGENVKMGVLKMEDARKKVMELSEKYKFKIIRTPTFLILP